MNEEMGAEKDGFGVYMPRRLGCKGDDERQELQAEKEAETPSDCKRQQMRKFEGK